MKAVVLSCIFFLLICSTTVSGRETESTRRHPTELAPDMSHPGLIDPKLPTYTAAAVDTYNIVWFDFEALDWQGWTRVDKTAQIATWFHADDFSGLGGGSAGRLVAIEGSQSAWCGARPTDDPYEYMCGWMNAPGYGNTWDQSLATGEILFTGTLYLSYHGVFDSEPAYDFTYVEYDAGNGNWVRVQSWDGIVDTIITHEIRITKNTTKLRFHFVSDGGWSDKDGWWPSDGACIIDSITIADDSTPDPLIDFEDFEDWAWGATENAGDVWYGYTSEAYGLYSALYHGLDDKDPCNDNPRTQAIFFHGSTYPSASYPGLFDTPFCTGPGNISEPCQNELIVSPVIDMTKYSTNNDEIQDADIPPADRPFLGGTVLRMTHYRDIPLSNLVFYVWHVRDIDPITGCPGQWLDHDAVYYGPDKDYLLGTGTDISDLISGDNPVQLAIGVIDLCFAWYNQYGDCAAHTPSPWFDNIRLQRYKTTGPQWKYIAWDMFQDNFPEIEYDLESWVRADMAIELNAPENPTINPGDSMVISCSAKMAGSLRNGGVTGKAEVYMHVRATDIGPFGKPALFGPQLEGTYGTYVSDDGEWTIIQCDSAIWWGAIVIQDEFMVDLNDSLFTRGYMIEYYFIAWDADNYSSTSPRYASEGQYFEFTCLPTGKSDILFVDDYHGRGRTFEGTVETYWNPTFAAVIAPENQPDRYDVNNPSSMLGNGPGGRSFLNQIRRNEGSQSGYTIIIWDSGSLNVGTITDGTPQSDKSDDCTMLINWLDQSENDVGLLVCGDEIAKDLISLTSTQSMELLSSWCGVNLVEASYFDLTGGRQAGGVVNPLCTTTAGWPGGSGKQFYAFGGCPIVNQFDVIDATANGVVALFYPDYDEESYAAGIRSITTNAAGYDARTMWFGFSWMSITDVDGGETPLIRNDIFNDIYLWFNGIPNTNITEDEVPRAYKLAQNFPNPFNPATTIFYDVRAKGHVSIKIYNVAGQLVRTLVDEVMDAGNYSKEWKGANNIGADVASGIYFYRMESKSFSATRKMVLLR